MKINKIGLISLYFFLGWIQLLRFYLFKPCAITITHNNDNFIPMFFLNRKIEQRNSLRAKFVFVINTVVTDRTTQN